MISTSRILVPHDGSEMSDKALDKAIEFCKSFKSELIILYVVDDRLIPSDAILGFIREKLTLENAKVQTLKILKMGAEAMLRERMKKASGYGVNVKFIIRMGSPAEGITDVAASEKEVGWEDDEHDSHSVLSGIKEKLVVADLINQLNIADGLKGLLINRGFTLKSLLNTSAPDLAKILGIDQYVAKLISDAISKAIKMSGLQADK